MIIFVNSLFFIMNKNKTSFDIFVTSGFIIFLVLVAGKSIYFLNYDTIRNIKFFFEAFREPGSKLQYPFL